MALAPCTGFLNRLLPAALPLCPSVCLSVSSVPLSRTQVLRIHTARPLTQAETDDEQPHDEVECLVSPGDSPCPPTWEDKEALFIGQGGGTVGRLEGAWACGEHAVLSPVGGRGCWAQTSSRLQSVLGVEVRGQQILRPALLRGVTVHRTWH